MLDATPSVRPAARTPRAGSDAPLFAAIDLGTNNCRLLIAAVDVAARRLQVVDSFSRIVRLGEGVSEHGVLSDEAMQRTLAALKTCQKKIAKHSVLSARFVATEACRRATNSPAFLQQIATETGLEIDVITPDEEAQLAFLGCSSLLAEQTTHAIVFDIGGGSTEFLWVDVSGAAHGVKDWLSVECGVMNLGDRFGGQSFADMAYPDMVAYMQRRIAPFDAKNNICARLSEAGVQLLSTSGTVTTLAAIHLGLPRYDRSKIDGQRFRVEDIRATTAQLLAMRPSERFNHACIGPDRADFILSGCAIFEAISNVWPAAEITIADRGVREGIILSLASEAA